MLSPVQLQVFPSCYNALSCSADGELALATGEFMYIVTPKNIQEGDNASASQPTDRNWQINRFRANLFTNKEWPSIFPQMRDHFSVGAEQSISSVAGLAWSPAGLAKHRRCALAVLTTSLLLSFYENVGSQGKWKRVCVVNEALRQYFDPLVSDPGLRGRKSNIRSFAWFSPLRLPPTDPSNQSAESKWGIHLFAVTNDDNDVICLRVQRTSETSQPYSLDVLSVTSLQGEEGKYPISQPSVFASAVKSRLKTLSMSCGPWTHQETGKQDWSAIANVAVVCGSKIKIIKQEVQFHLNIGGPYEQGQYTYSSCVARENTAFSAQELSSFQVIGPLQWIYTGDIHPIHLAAGTMGGMLLISASQQAYKGADREPGKVQIQEFPFYNESTDAAESKSSRHWEPIGAMTAAMDEACKTCTLHIGTVGGYTASMTFPSTQTEIQLSTPAWKTQMDEIREGFDIDRDLGGLTVSRVWGLTSCRGVVMTAFTRHPGDMIEYRTSAEDMTVILFSGTNTDSEELSNFPIQQTSAADSPENRRAKRDTLLDYILDVERRKHDDQQWSMKIAYAAACCAILQSKDLQILQHARNSLEWVGTVTGADVTEEIAKCSNPGTLIASKSSEELNGPGQHIFEKCDICDEGLSWYSPREAQCSSGHLFVRCGVSFLAIQEPGISKFCSLCETEYLNEELIGDSYGADVQATYRQLADAFDTCIYCGGKFRA